MVSRISDRAGMDPEFRLRLLEGDVDQLEQKMLEGIAAVRREQKEQNDEVLHRFGLVDERFQKVTGILISVLVALVTSSIMLALTVILVR